MNRALGWTMTAAFLAVSPVDASGSQGTRGGVGGSEPCLLQRGVNRLKTPSKACLRCHDGLRGVFAGRRGAHPVEIPYRPGSYGQREMRSNPERRAMNLALPGGRITCLTCHDPRSRLRSHLAARAEGPIGTRLCDGCHVIADPGSVAPSPGAASERRASRAPDAPQLRREDNPLGGAAASSR